jgi:phage-related protein
MGRVIKFYETEAGVKPVKEYLDTLDDGQTEKATWVMRLVERLDIVPVKFFQKMTGTDGIWEIRVEYESNIFRILGFFDGAVFFVAAHAFQKKTKKTPPKEIKTAEDRKKDYFRRKVK